MNNTDVNNTYVNQTHMNDSDDLTGEEFTRRQARRRRRLVAGLASVAVAGTVAVASAATLGGVTPTSLGADQSEIVSCETDGVSVDQITAYDPSADGGAGAYIVTDVEVSDISPTCAGQELSVTLADSSGAAIAEAGTMLAANGQGNGQGQGQGQGNDPISVTIPVTPTPMAEDVVRVALVITG